MSLCGPCDRGKTDEFLLVAMGALASEPRSSGSLARDPNAPLVVLARVLDHHLGRKDPRSGLAALETAAKAGWITPADLERDPRLGMLIRRVQADIAAPAIR